MNVHILLINHALGALLCAVASQGMPVLVLCDESRNVTGENMMIPV